MTDAEKLRAPADWFDLPALPWHRGYSGDSRGVRGPF